MRTERILLGTCGVDSGQLIIVDPCYVDKGFDYNKVCCSHTVASGGGKTSEMFSGYTYHDGYGGPFGGAEGYGDQMLGVVTGTGFGDGEYEVWAEVEDHGSWGKRVARITIDFMQEDEEE